MGRLKGISGANPKNAAIWFEPKHVKGVHCGHSWCVVKAGKVMEVNCQNMMFSRITVSAVVSMGGRNTPFMQLAAKTKAKTAR
jgi:hypothetical protein